jgi:hypothetical protein
MADHLTRTREIFDQLEAYCRRHDWTGCDPYDALNSEYFARTPMARSAVARLAFTQILKRSPIDLRPLLAIRPQQDPKATALFLMAYVKKARLNHEGSRAIASTLAGRLLSLRSPSSSYWCWGYSFPWQTRTKLVPRFAPNLVGTVFAANALLDAYEIGLGADHLTAAVSAGEYLARELYWSNGVHTAFAYPRPDTRVPVHNANFLGAALLCRLAKLTGERGTLDRALGVARYSAHCQRQDGAWSYGLASTQQWIDNFHTGYNLCALHSIAAALDTDEFDHVIARGFRFYQDHFFEPSGAAKYFHDRTFPIDIHSVAQSLITLTAFRDLDHRADRLARAVLDWAMAKMWDDRGFFYYRVQRVLTIRTSYMRWSQAWMLLALATLLERPSDVPRQ